MIINLDKLRDIYKQPPNSWCKMVGQKKINLEEFKFLCKKWKENDKDKRCKKYVDTVATDAIPADLQALANAFGGEVID